MKRAELERHLRNHGCGLYREGAKHAVWWNPANRKTASLRRHSEIKNPTAWAICRQLEVPKP